MSRENVEVVRRVLEAWNRRDADASRQYLASDIEWEPATPAIVEGAVHRGLEEVVDATVALWEIWDVFRFEEAEIRDLDPAVVWPGGVHIKGSASHVELDQEFGVHCVLNDGKITRAKAFLSWREASKPPGCGSR